MSASKRPSFRPCDGLPAAGLVDDRVGQRLRPRAGSCHHDLQGIHHVFPLDDDFPALLPGMFEEPLAGVEAIGRSAMASISMSPSLSPTAILPVLSSRARRQFGEQLRLPPDRQVFLAGEAAVFFVVGGG